MYPYTDDGRDLLIRFVGLNEDIEQFEILSSPITPIVGT